MFIRRLIKAYRKINRFMRVIGYFSTRSFIFKSTNLHEMMARVSKKDKEVFFCDLRELDWDDYFVTYVVGARIHLTKDPVETIPEGKKHYRR